MMGNSMYLFEIGLSTKTLESELSSRLLETALFVQNVNFAAEILAF